MLTLRPAHLEALRTDRIARFELALVETVKAQFPAEVAALGPPILPAVVHNAVAAAQELQLDDDFAISNFVFLAVSFQPDFLTAKKTKWMADFLDDQASSPETRVLSLFEAMWRIRRYHSFLIAAKAPPPPEVTPKT